jgi:hypothetical protein
MPWRPVLDSCHCNFKQSSALEKTRRVSQGDRGHVLQLKNRFVVASAVYLAIIWVIACLPLAAVLLEFGNVNLCPDGRMLGWFIATLYGSFFIFPAFVGGILAVALVLPLATTMALSLGKRESYVLVAFLIVTSVSICALEFIYSPGALFEVRPQVITSHPTFFAGVQSAACRDQTFVGYSSQLGPLLASGRSSTGVLYYPGFVALTLMQNTLFVVFVAFLYFKREQIEQRAPYFSYGISYILGYSQTASF